MSLIFDLETNGLLDTGDKIHCLVIKDTETGEVTSYSGNTYEIERGVRRLGLADCIIGHNIIKFDIPFIQMLFAGFEPRLVRDTIVCTRLIYPNLKELDFGYAKTHPEFPKNLIGRHSLESWGHRLGVHKGEYKDGWETFTPEMLKYCVQDVEVTETLWNKIQSKNYSEQAIQIEHDFATIMFAQEQHGFRFDMDAAHKLHAKLGQRRLVIERELQEIFPGWSEDMKTPEYWYVPGQHKTFATKKEAGKLAKRCVAGPMKQKITPFNPGSRDHIARVLVDNYGWKPKQFTDGGKPQVDETVLEAMTFPEAKVLLEYLMIEKRLGQLAEGDQAWLKQEKKGRIHGEVNCMGTVTSRCSHARPNMGQVPAIDKPYGKDCRALFLANEGHVLVGADASGIQLRALAHYLQRWDDGLYVGLVTGGDPHAANQKAAGLPTRDTAKTFIYAWLLGAGDRKIGEIIGKGAAAGRELKARFLQNLPAFKHLTARLEVRVKESGSITGLDGRIMPVKTAHFALASLLQGFEAVVMKLATSLYFNDLTQRGYVHGTDFGLCAMIHDEWQVSARKEIADEVGKTMVAAIKKSGEILGSKCPLDGQFKVGQNWCETH